MRKGGGKEKGSTQERAVCVALSLWVSNGAKRDLYWRSAMSGGRATVGAKRGIDLARQAGDISAVAPEGHALTNKFFIECKAYKDLNLEAFIVSNKGLLAKFWQTAQTEAKRHNREPVIIAKGNFMPTLIITRHKFPLNMNPLARLPTCVIGLFERTLKTRFNAEEMGL